MAQQDTGLGWSASEGWLMQLPGFMGNMSGWTGATKIPQCEPNAVDIINNGIYGWSDTVYKFYYAMDPSVDGYIFRSTQYTRFQIISRTGGRQVIYRARIRIDGTGTPAVAKYNFGSGASGWYAWADGISNATDINTSIPLYATLADGYAAMTEVANAYYKLNAGYAVAGFVTWNNLANERVTAPFLISTEGTAVKLSRDGSTDAGALETGLRWQNRRFIFSLLTGQDGDLSGLLVNSTDVTGPYPGPINITTLFEALATVSNIQVTQTTDPYNDQGDPSGPGGGDGEQDEEEDVDFSGTPSVGTSLGFFRMWNPSETELRSLASWMWSSAFDLDTFKRIFSAPIDAILGLSLVPVQPSVIGGYTIVLGGIDTEISAFTVTNRYVTLDCGSLSVAERWGAYLDYSPYTKMSIFLPYIGFRDISTDDVMDKTIALQYNVDVLSGACVAELKCGGTVLYSWQGNCAQQLPITSQDWSSALSAALGLAGSAAAAIVSGGSSLPLAGTVASATVNALSLKPRMERGGSISGAAGAMAGQVPYLVRERPEQAVPGRQNHFIGYPSFTTVTLGSITGYTEVESIHLEGIPATAAELAELENILKEGFIL